jgi:hypothetical protein
MDNSMLSCPKHYSTGFYKNDQDKYVTNNSFAKSAIILLDFSILKNAKTFLSLIPNASLLVNLWKFTNFVALLLSSVVELVIPKIEYLLTFLNPSLLFLRTLNTSASLSSSS